jgi:hypothetical protein
LGRHLPAREAAKWLRRSCPPALVRALPPFSSAAFNSPVGLNDRPRPGRRPYPDGYPRRGSGARVDQVGQAVSLPITNRIANKAGRNPREIIRPVIVDVIAVRRAVLRSRTCGCPAKDAQNSQGNRCQHGAPLQFGQRRDRRMRSPSGTSPSTERLRSATGSGERTRSRAERTFHSLRTGWRQGSVPAAPPES